MANSFESGSIPAAPSLHLLGLLLLLKWKTLRICFCFCDKLVVPRLPLLTIENLIVMLELILEATWRRRVIPLQFFPHVVGDTHNLMLRPTSSIMVSNSLPRDLHEHSGHHPQKAT
mmetsp:Transcript_13335/g.37434  ORF Transcript_13335/g.37434 Transcript_13335/m.37434 type:complete len:116 (-) Transcript_13335:58-405(-)